MFTGIVEETGAVVDVRTDTEGKRIRVASSFADALDHGESISVSGACLTVEDVDGDGFELFLSRETLDRTYLDDLEPGDEVNLERAMPADGRFDGHLVQGHVDGTATVTRVERVGDDWTFGFSLPPSLARYVVEKGSITVDGISLTVADLTPEEFTVAIIPATYDLTNLSGKEPGDPVHVEVDVLAKYVERMVREGAVETPLLDGSQ
ncbi:riboflavin synthase [Halomarina ordinaria]|uniref:Riboflavin synthase n=1 Tax=Halomarina ordinaria TaxID=3033939 RepID=A0ABD5UBA6_9EURY|nr:riboflavin synthase [Halomarina sp. PSRA2]